MSKKNLFWLLIVFGSLLNLCAIGAVIGIYVSFCVGIGIASLVMLIITGVVLLRMDNGEEL